jgi:hypothetical protein
VFLAKDTEQDLTAGSPPSLLGSLDPVTWERTQALDDPDGGAASSVVDVADGVLIVGVTIDGVRVSGGQSDGAMFARATVFNTGLRDAVVVQSGAFGRSGAAGTSRFVSARIDISGSGSSFSGDVDFIRSSLVAIPFGNGNVRLVDSSARETQCIGARIQFFHSNLRGAFSAVRLITGCTIELVNVVVDAPTAVVMQGGTTIDLAILGVLVSPSSHVLQTPDGVYHDDVAALAVLPSVRELEGLVAGNPGIGADGFSLVPGAGLDVGVDPFLYGAPSTAAADYEGDCRAAPYDLGADG